MAVQVEVPSLGESVTQAILVTWHKKDGDAVAVDEPIAELETDKANVDIPARAAGILKRLKEEGDTVNVGEAIARIEDGAAASTKSPVAAVITSAPGAADARPAAPTATLEDYSPAVRRLIEEHRVDPGAVPATGPGGRLTKEDMEKFVAERDRNGDRRPAPPAAAAPVSPSTSSGPRPPQAAADVERRKDQKVNAEAPTPQESSGPMQFDAAGIHRAPMSKIRRRIAETLVRAQQTAAILTTFNEVDLTEIINLRAKFKDRFQEVHGVGLGFMSFFARAVVLSLREWPRLNAFIDGNDMVYHNYVNLGIAVSTDRGLAVPVLRNVEKMSFARIEAEIKRMAMAVREGKLSLEELSGGTFTITNGGVFGSLLSTPILTPPQSGILGMHTIQRRPMVVNDRIEIRSMMYLALSYDHRIVDGREAIGFLVRVKQLLEDPARLMLEI